jgi:type VI secretion system protein ImpL
MRVLFEALGILLLALLIWFAGPYFAFADWRPFAPVWSRLTLIGLVVAVWAGFKLAKVLKARQANAKLASEAVAQPDPAPSSDEVQLRERFEEAIRALKDSHGRDYNLYSQPWYVIIGPPGSGKTTLLANSGLQFPLEKRFGREAVRGVGGTRNCDWWFTDDAVFLDTAGRFTTQDSDPGSDSRGWREFLALLKKYRSRRPINGIILGISLGDLLTLTVPGRDAQIAATRRRIEELNRELNIQLPVYLLFTKCDLIAGFNEYFDDLTAEERKQVWGVTFPYDQTKKGGAAPLFAEEFDRLVARLNERLWPRLEQERQARRRAKIFGFPQQVAALKDVLNQFVTEAFVGTRMDLRVQLRGVYFTSGTQEGTPIDRLLGALGRAFAFEPQQVAAAGYNRGGKAYFVERLLREVVLPESGLAGVNRRLEIKIAAAQTLCYIALAVVTVLLVIAFSVSYSVNSQYLQSVRAELVKLDSIPAVRPDAAVEQVALRLDGVKRVDDVANSYRDGTPVSLRWGLYTGASIGRAADDGYRRTLNGLLLPKIVALFKQRLYDYAAEPEKLYEYLKAYLMFGDPRRLDKAQLQFMTDLEWTEAYGANPALAQSLKTHSHRLLESEELLPPVPLDNAVVEQARSTIRHASIPRLMYGELKLSYASDTEHGIRLDREAGLGLDRVLARRSGRSWSDPVPALYTKKTFNEISGLGTVELVARFARENWVIGDDSVSLASTPQLTAQLLDIYEKDYIAAWDAVLNDLRLPPLKGITQMSDTLAIISSREASPFRGLLQTIDENTYLVKPADDKSADSLASRAQKAVQDRLGKLLGNNTNTGPKPGTQVTEHFAPLHALLAGPPGAARIDGVLQKVAQVQQQLNTCGGDLGQKSPEECVKRDPGPVKTLSQEARTLPDSVGPIIEAIASAVDRAGVGAAGAELLRRYEEEIIPTCNDIVGARYPFQAASHEDVPIADFGRLFGYGGLFDTFYKSHLADLVDTTSRPWRWKASQSGAAPGSEALLREFERAQAIREIYFRPGSDHPEFAFSLAPASLDSEATRVVLDVDGQSLEYRHGPIRPVQEKWPGPANGSAAVSFEERGGAHPSLSYQGPWAWFHMIDAGRLQPDTAVRWRLTYSLGGHTAEFALEPVSVFNPLGKTELQRFSCRY